LFKWGGEKLEATIMQHNIEEELEPNLNHVINNIQVKLVVFTELVVSIIELVVAAIKSFKLVQPEIELI
jgi:hypothetical protein